MPRGRGRGGSGHKGQRRHFSNPDQLEENKDKKERERRWRQQRGEISSDEEGKSSEESSSEEEEEETAEEAEAKAKGVQHLIEVENPNRIVKKEKKVATLPDAAPTEEAQPQLSRREREELEKQKAKVQYQKAHAAGKTAEAKADLARLAIIKQQREEAAKKRDLEIQVKKEAELAKAEQTKKALGKRT